MMVLNQRKLNHFEAQALTDKSNRPPY